MVRCAHRASSAAPRRWCPGPAAAPPRTACAGGLPSTSGAATARSRSPSPEPHPIATHWAVDVNDHALEHCRRNAERLGVRGVRCARPEHVPDDVRFDFIVSNPAIRIGKPQLHAMLRHWLDRLVPGGKADLVVRKHLGAGSLQRWRWLGEQGWPTERYASQKGFRILCRTTAQDG
ncbi:methyltransferase [Streptomyces olivaceoviridis]